MIQRTIVLPLILLYSAAVQGVPPPDAVPAVLLAAPINAAWASAHTDLWKQKGIQGFLLSGIVDSMDDNAAAPDHMASLRDATGPLVSEVKLAHSRLAAAGVGENFCLVPLSPDLRYFTDPQTAARATGLLAVAGEFCAKTDLKGIAFDTRSSSMFFDYRWDGYEYKDYTPESLRDAAREFGRRCGRAMVKNLPNADILVITDGMRSWRPLYLDYLGGLIEEFHGGRNKIHLLTRETFIETDAARIAETAAITRSVLRERLNGRARDTWEKRGTVALGMCPLGYRDEAGRHTPAVHYSAAAFRRQVAAAKTWSDRYVWIEAAGSLWWQVSDDEKTIYASIIQNGSLLKSQTDVLPPEFDAYSAACRFDPLRRVGPFPFKDNACFVFDSEEGAAAFFPNGVASEIVVGVEGPRVRATNMATGERQTLTAGDGQVRLDKTNEPLLVDPLPLRQWVPAAGLWLTMAEPPTPGADTAPVHYGFVNRTFSDLSATLNVALPAGFSLNPGHLDLAELAPLEKIEANGTLRGRFAPDANIDAAVTCVIAGGTTESRPYTIHASPNLIWQCETDGPMPCGVAPANIDRAGTTDFLAATKAGDVVRIGADGAVRWRKRFPATFTSPPVCGRDSAGNAFIVLADTTGKLTALGELGNTLWQCEAEAAGTIVCEDLDAAAGDEIVCARNNGGVAAYRANGEALWKIDGLPGNPLLCRGPGSVFMARAGEKNHVQCIGSTGQVTWTRSLESAPACEPLLCDLKDDGKPELVVAGRDGTVSVLDTQSGETKQSRKVVDEPLMAVAAGKRPENGKGFLVASTSHSVMGLSGDLAQDWACRIRATGPPVVVAQARETRILVPARRQPNYAGPPDAETEWGGALVCLDGKGSVVWRDTHSPAQITGAPVLVQDAAGHAACIYAAEDCRIRKIDAPMP